MNDPSRNLNDLELNSEKLDVEKLVHSIPLKTPTRNCDDNVLALLNQLVTETEFASPKPALPDSRSAKPAAGIILSALSTAAALLVGLLVGTMVSRPGPSTSSNFENRTRESLSRFELSDNVQVVEGESRTVIVEDSIQIQNDVPVRKLETVTHKKVRVRDSQNQSEKEYEIPIRKVFFALAETI